MWKCERCGAKFDDPDSKTICYEQYFGVASMFPNMNYGDISICPECGSEDIDTYYDDIVTYCDVCESCEDCPRYGDDCDGKEIEEWAD